MQHSSQHPLLLLVWGGLLLSLLTAPQAEAEELRGILRSARGETHYFLAEGGRRYRVQGEVPPEIRFVRNARIVVDALRGSNTIMLKRLVTPQLEELDLDVQPRAEGANWEAISEGTRYTLSGRTRVLGSLGVQGALTVRGYRLPDEGRIVIEAVRAKTTGLSATRVAVYIPMPPPLRIAVPRGLIRKGREVWLTSADKSFATFTTRRGQERLLKVSRIALSPRRSQGPAKAGITATLTGAK